MADIRINALATTAASTASDDFIAVDGSANGTRKLNAYSPTFGGNLTVSGTGTSTFSGVVGVQSTAASFGSGVGQIYVREGATPTKRLFMGYDTTLDGGYIVSEQTGVANKSLYIQPGGGGTVMGGNLTVSGTGNSSVAGTLLVATTTNSSNGKIQLADHTTSAGGIGFGTDVSLFRSAAGVLRLASTSNYSHEIVNTGGTGAATTSYSNTGGYLFVGIDSSSGGALGGGAYAGVIARDGAYSLVLRTNSTTALTLDSSQNATFAKKMAINGAALTYDFNLRASTSNTGSTVFRFEQANGTEILAIRDNGTVIFAGDIRINNTVNTVSPTSPNRTITMTIGGTTYYIPAKTTND